MASAWAGNDLAQERGLVGRSWSEAAPVIGKRGREDEIVTIVLIGRSKTLGRVKVIQQEEVVFNFHLA